MGKLFGPSFKELAEMEVELRKREKNNGIADVPKIEFTVDIKNLTTYQKTYLVLVKLLFALIIVAAALWTFNIIYIKSTGTYITEDEFNQIEIGMSYQEVVETTGTKGTLSGEVNLGIGDEYETKVYRFDGLGIMGSATITFQGGKVAMKTQFGLN